MLDGLDAHSPAAQRSRRDLRRIHRVMRTRSILLGGLAELGVLRRDAGTLRVLELGAGDGTLLLGVARALARPAAEPARSRVELTLLDRQPCVEPSTIVGYGQAGWDAVAVVADVIDWASGNVDLRTATGALARWDLIVASLFLHHFADEQLGTLLGAIASRTDLFLACEPRRGPVALAGSHMIGALGVNAVTRNDAVLSVRAGFADSELSALWPAPRGSWRLREYRAAPFSHCLVAQRRDPA
jgi:hypothetical protein